MERVENIIFQDLFNSCENSSNEELYASNTKKPVKLFVLQINWVVSLRLIAASSVVCEFILKAHIY